jgi:hypothetical protein
MKESTTGRNLSGQIRQLTQDDPITTVTADEVDQPQPRQDYEVASTLLLATTSRLAFELRRALDTTALLFGHCGQASIVVEELIRAINHGDESALIEAADHLREFFPEMSNEMQYKKSRMGKLVFTISEIEVFMNRTLRQAVYSNASLTNAIYPSDDHRNEVVDVEAILYRGLPKVGSCYEGVMGRLDRMSNENRSCDLYRSAQGRANIPLQDFDFQDVAFSPGGGEASGERATMENAKHQEEMNAKDAEIYQLRASLAKAQQKLASVNKKIPPAQDDSNHDEVVGLSIPFSLLEYIC